MSLLESLEKILKRFFKNQNISKRFNVVCWTMSLGLTRRMRTLFSAAPDKLKQVKV